ncbi:MAG: acetyl-CoA acetyltransferase [Bdellovibrionales bacterium GWB1_52_6]|nr:MAG: acetyl-CoA acetyltransferase [Bdellovibrionales bacterium GWB1_52_6]OFZ06027.1 MAG: acetyl-CoA acetyltransferase [Bdellovibrionales bacterium GWA1_52_35]HCM39348.1 acetyl-CoA C-acetyltransferase [Bdellovibrionales bacterium]
MREVVIVGTARTPFGSFQGALSSVPAPKLGAVAIEAALKRAGVAKDQVSEVIMGNVLTAGEGQAPARQAALAAGLPKSVPCMTINKVCGSGMKAIMLGAQSIITGDSDVVVAGGMENMSMVPYILPTARNGFRMGHQQVVDTMIYDGLWDPYNNQHMGNCGELCAKEKNFSRQDQDTFAISSFLRAQEAQKSGKFKNEIAAVEITGKKGDITRIETDEGPAKGQPDKIPGLKPAFDKNGTITPANASTINDGAAAVVLMSAEKAKELGIKPLARIVSHGTFAQDPLWFTTAPAEAMRRAMKKANWTASNVDLWEVNEAFAVVALAAERELEIPRDKLNVWGGAISLGHPIGASGARVIVTLLSALTDKNLKRGVAGICIGGGEATAICIERI